MCVCTGCSRSNSWVTRYEREKKKRIFYSSMFVRFLRNEIKNETFCSFFFFFFFWSISRGQIRREEKKILTSFQKYCLFKDYEDKLFFLNYDLIVRSLKKEKKKKKLKELKKLKKKKIKKVETLFSFPELFPYLGRTKRIECTWNEWRVWRRKENDRETDGGQRRRGERRFRRVIGSAGVDAILSSIPHQPPPGNLYLLSLPRSHPLPPPVLTFRCLSPLKPRIEGATNTERFIFRKVETTLRGDRASISSNDDLSARFIILYYNLFRFWCELILFDIDYFLKIVSLFLRSRDFSNVFQHRP